MGLNDILLRTTSNPPLTTKGSDLTWTEGDANWIEIYNALIALNSVNGLAVYDPGTTYTGTIFVAYNQNVWKHVSGSPSTGVTPGSNPAVWQLSSVGELSHQQNTDTYMGFGTSEQVSVSEIFDIINNRIIPVADSSAFIALQQARNLKPNRLYYCLSEKILVRSIDVDTYDNFGYWVASMPDVNLHDLFDYGGSYSVNDTVYYNALVYENLTGSISASPPPSDGTNWQLIPAYTTPEYLLQPFRVSLLEVAGSFAILELWDRTGNRYAQNSIISIIPNPTGTKLLNEALASTVDIRNYMGGFLGNHISRNSNIQIGYEIGTGGNVDNCKFSNVQFDMGSADDTLPKTGTIDVCTFEDCTVDFPDGFEGDLTGVDIHLRTGLTCQLDKDLSLSGRKITMDGGNAEVECDQSTYGSGTQLSVQSASFTYLDIFGVYVLSNPGATNWQTITNGFPYAGVPYKIKTDSASTLNIVTTNWAGGSAGSFLYDGSTLTIDGSKGDWITVVGINIGGGTIAYKIIEVQIQP